MYKLLLCWRYLRTRYIALASIISVMLGVATMIVVNSVMAGFTHEMQDRIHGILSDVVFESHSLDGFPDPERHMERIREVAGEYIAGMTPTVVIPAMLIFEVHGQWRHAAGQLHRHRREDARPGQRLQPLLAASGESRAAELRLARRRLRHASTTRPDPSSLPRERMEYAGWDYRRMQGPATAPRREAAEAAAATAEIGRRRRARGRIPSTQVAEARQHAGPEHVSIRPRSSTPASSWASRWRAFACTTAAIAFWCCPATT